jgi:CheY-like chemotaxis protein
MTIRRLIELQDGAPTPVADIKKFDLLYVEDEDLNWEVTCLNLHQRYNIRRAVDAVEAFARLKERKFHAVLMDIQLSRSDLSGVEITKVLRGTYKGTPPSYAASLSPLDTPIIFMTAYAANYSRADLVALGGVDLVTKPVNFARLALAISRALLNKALSAGGGSA